MCFSSRNRRAIGKGAKVRGCSAPESQYCFLPNPSCSYHTLTRVFKLLHIPAILEVLAQAASAEQEEKGTVVRAAWTLAGAGLLLLKKAGPGQVLGCDTHRAGFWGLKGMLREQQAPSW